MAKSRRRRNSSLKPNKRKGAGGGGYLRFVADAGVFCLTVILGLTAVFAYVAKDLPDTRLLWRDDGVAKITLLSAAGAPMPIRGVSSGAPIRLADLPPYVGQAVMAVEDRNFYHHHGVNPVSVLRAFAVNAKHGAVVQGGSTITQQLAKNVFLTNERTVKRKAQELLLAIWLERKFSKEEILTLYLNRVYFGAGAHGIDAASYRYFAKPARDLSLGEAAVLAGLLKAPSRYAPTTNPQDAGRRGRHVIEQMIEAGFLSSTQAKSAIAQPVRIASTQFATAPYFVDHVMRELRVLIGDVDADLIVHTTYDAEVQAAAENGFDAGFSIAEHAGELQGAAVVLDNEGAVRAMIGGRDYAVSQFNRAVQAQRQPGSAFKPIVFLAALEAGLKPEDIVLDAPVRIGKWSPDNYKSKFYGPVSMEDALIRSLNGATVRVQEAVGRKSVTQMARALGWEGKLTPGPAVALGVDVVSPLRLAGVYTPLSNGGYKVRPHAIEKVTTANGQVLYSRAPTYSEPAAGPHAVSQMNQMLGSVVTHGTGRAAYVPGYEAKGKTGTTQEHRDGWFAGHAGGLVCVVWVGRDDNAPHEGLSGGKTPAVIWREIMARALPPLYVAPLQTGDNGEPRSIDEVLSRQAARRD